MGTSKSYLITARSDETPHSVEVFFFVDRQNSIVIAPHEIHLPDRHSLNELLTPVL